MSEAHDFIAEFYAQIKALHQALKTILKEEGLLKEHLFVQHGFLLKRYSLQESAVDIPSLETLRRELERGKALETDLQFRITQNKKIIKNLEKAYNAYLKEKLPVEKIFTQYMNNAFYLSELAITRVTQLIELLQSSKTLYRGKEGDKAHSLLTSVEKMLNQILKFVDLVYQLHLKIAKFEKQYYYPSARWYGRMMSTREYKKTLTNGILSSSKDPTPVFDCPPSVKTKIFALSLDQRQNFFRAIGVRSADKMVIFQTPWIPPVGPVPQSNGLREYKFPKGTPIEVLEAA